MDEYKSRLSTYLSDMVREELKKYDGGFTDEMNDQRGKNAEVLGYKLSGKSDIKEGKFGKFDTGAAFKGNGMTIYDRNQSQGGDYKNIAHIGEDGKLTIWDKNIKKEPKLMQSLKKISQEFKTSFKESVNEAEIRWGAVDNAIIKYIKHNVKVLEKPIKAKDEELTKKYLKGFIDGLVNAQRSLKLESVNEAKYKGYDWKRQNRKDGHPLIVPALQKTFANMKDLKKYIDKHGTMEYVNEGKLSENYKNSEWEVYVKDEKGNEKIVKKAKSKRAATILYNKIIKSDDYYEVGMKVVKESVNEAKISVEPNWEGMWRFFKRMAKTNPGDWYKIQRAMGKEWTKINESTKEWGKTLDKIAKDRQLKSISKKDRDTLIKISKLMKGANESVNEKISKEEWAQYPAYARKLKPYMQKLLKVPLKVRVIKQANHNPWIEVRVAKFGKDIIPNDFRVKVAKSIGASSVRDWDNVNYGGIRVNSIDLRYNEWVKLLGNKVKTESVTEEAERDYKAEYKKYGSSTKAKKYRAELNQYNRKKGTYGNGDGKDASHKGGKIVGFESQSKNRGRAEKSRLKKEDIREDIGIEAYLGGILKSMKKAGLKLKTAQVMKWGWSKSKDKIGFLITVLDRERDEYTLQIEVDRDGNLWYLSAPRDMKLGKWADTNKIVRSLKAISKLPDFGQSTLKRR